MREDHEKSKAELIAELNKLRYKLRFAVAGTDNEKYRNIVEGLPQFVFELDTAGTYGTPTNMPSKATDTPQRTS